MGTSTESMAREGVYTVRDVATLLDLAPHQIRAFVQAQFLAPVRGARGEYRFSFRDVVLLKTAKGLVSANIPPARVRVALTKLREQLPEGTPLTGVTIHAVADDIVVRDGTSCWNPESGQSSFDFDVSELARSAEPLGQPLDHQQSLDAEEWFELGADLEADEPRRACEAYRHAVALDSRHADAHINLGRLLHEAGDAVGAERHYRAALEARPADATAAFNLGIALEDLGRGADAIGAYSQAIALDPSCADAYFNLARLYERAGRRTDAFRNLKTYKQLADGA